MRTRYHRLLALIGLLGSGLLQGAEPADLMVVGDIYTVDSARSWARVLAAKNGKIIYVGPENGSEAYRAESTKVITLESGQMVLPGIQDSHVHLLDGGLDELKCDLLNLPTPKRIIEVVKAYSEEHPNDPWILGAGWAPPLYRDGNPNKADLDKILPNRPAWLTSQDGHSGWANSAALDLAGIDKNTPDPPRGRIERDPLTREPTGTLRESAMNLVEDITPKPEDTIWEAVLLQKQREANGLGITSIQEALISPRALKVYHTLATRGELTLKVQCALATDAAKPDSQVDDFIALREQYTVGDRLRASSAKIFEDGGIEGHTAALLEPYVDRPGDSGEVYWDLERLTSIGKRLDQAGFQLHVHVIGDKATRVVLDAIEAIRKDNGFSDTRPQLAHLELVAPSDIARFRKLGTVANFSPMWCYSDAWIVEGTIPALGPERSGRLYQIQSFLNSGAVVSAGSDWPITALNPFEAIQVGITRIPLDNPSAPPWTPEERATLPDLIAMYTINGAYANHHEKTTGSLETGKAADFIIIDRNLFDVPVLEIRKTRVLRTYLDGKEVWPAELQLEVRAGPEDSLVTLTISNSSGEPLDAAAASRMELRAGSSLSSSRADWTVLPVTLEAVGGVLQAVVPAAETIQFIEVLEK
ncbi:MAG TPA: amidohydrolase [Verrucomicrobiota bacterium]|nr:amidohydrolase [Verrucomicrobiales bacterium]HRI13440.1 amidohydrolase [Verrucomicrobiota bacterium]